MEALEQALRQMITISPAEMQAFGNFLEKRHYKRKSFLSDADRYIDEVYFVEQGILRVLITDRAGTEHTTHFALENQFIADYQAFIVGKKSQYQLQALEATDVIVLPRAAVEWGYEHMQDGQKLGRLIAEYYFVYLDQRIQDQYTLSPRDRYERMSQIFPDIHNRVPQHMIASYIGITPVHLSRLKKQVLLSE
ncbi:MAG: cyclic nucleotide-binding domain-containing protein [Bacteroidota bacterium]